MGSIDFREELKQLNETLLGEIASNMLRHSQVVSGKTLESLEFEIPNNNTSILYAAPWIMALDTGRGPSKGGAAGEPSLKDIIKQWIQDKHIKYDSKDISLDSLAFVISRSIHEKGNLIHRNQKPTGIVTSVVTIERIETFVDVFAPKFIQYFRSEILQEINRK